MPKASLRARIEPSPIVQPVSPHSLEAERAVLGAVLISTKTWPIVSSSVSDRDFFRDAHRRIFLAMRRLAERAVALDLLTLADELRSVGDIDECGGPAYLASLTDGVPTSTNVEHYAAIVKEKARLRSLVEIGSSLLVDAYDGSRRASTIADEIFGRLSSASTARADGAVLARTAVERYVSDVVQGESIRLPSGLTDLDALIGGFRAQDLVIIAARPSVGKTSFALGLADRMSQANVVVPFFSLEMSRHALASQLLASRSRVESGRFERGLAAPDEYDKISATVASLSDAPLFLETTARTLTEIDGWCRRIRDERGSIGCAVIDYLQLLSPPERLDSRQEQVAAISRGLKRLAKDLNIVVIALSQLGRAPEARRDKRPHLSDLRESGALEQDADLALLLFREEMHAPSPEVEGIAEVIVAKHRSGPTGVVRVVFIKKLAAFDNLALGGL